MGWGRKALNGGAKERERDFNERVWQFVVDINWILERKNREHTNQYSSIFFIHISLMKISTKTCNHVLENEKKERKKRS